MNPIVTALIDNLLQLLDTPAFQAILKSILANLIKNIESGSLTSVAATRQAMAQMTTAATLHLTDNPVTDLHSLITTLYPITTPRTNETSGETGR